MVVWRVPAPVPPSQHRFNCRLVLVREGRRVVGYDNERGQGDHRHLRGREMAKRFIDIETLPRDLMNEVEASRCTLTMHWHRHSARCCK